ncbi:hypothetical protein GCM10027613_11010 [Microlunatus endophyticus]
MTVLAGPVRAGRGVPAPLHYAFHTLRLTLKNRGYVIFSIATPLILYVVFSQIFGGTADGGIDWSAVYMVSMAAYGSSAVR